jgi:hypothetical protein
MSDSIPSFVLRGLSWITSGVDGFSLRYRHEADLRDGLAALLWISGAEKVRTEVQVPNCGRIDVLLEEDEFVTAIEIKQELTTVSAARKAYQQANLYVSYLRTLPQYRGGFQIRSFLIANHVDWQIVLPAAKAFYDVTGQSFGQVLGDISTVGALRESHESLIPSAVRRDRLLERKALVAELAGLFAFADHLWVSNRDRTQFAEVSA